MKTISILILSFFSFFCSAQDFGKKGTVWQHCYLEELGFPIVEDYIEVQSLRDTVLQNLQCHELVLTHEPKEFGTNKSIVVCNDKERVYYLENDSLHLLYDFSLGKGDNYVVRYPIAFDSSYLNGHPNAGIYFNIRIDSVSNVNMNGQLLKKQHLTIDHASSNSDNILIGHFALERIGYENWIVPNWRCFLCEQHIFEGLHSFKDTDISFQDSSSRCLRTGNKILEKENNNMILFPVPTYDHLILKVPEGNEIQDIHIFDLSGKSFSFKSEIALNKTVLRFHLSPGLYLLEALLENGEVVHLKFMIGE